MKDYPAPLVPADDATEYSPTAAARLLDTSVASVRNRLKRGTLPGRRDGGRWLIARDALGLRSDVHPAAHGDSHPLTRTACAVGALTDMLVTRDLDVHRPRIEAASALALAEAVLRVAFDAAEHAVSRSDTSDAFRPLQIAQFARRALDRLSPAGSTAPLPYIAIPPPRESGATPNDRLDAALHTWIRIAYEDLSLSVPSIEVVRNVAGQSVHVLAAIDALVGAPSQDLPASTLDRERLRTCAIAITTAGSAWGSATTGTPPSHAYVDAARDLHRTLHELITGPISIRSALAFGRDRALATLLDATNDVAALARRSTQISRQLLASRLLFAAPKAAKSAPDRLRARAAGHFVELRAGDLPDLCLKTTAADLAIARLAADARRAAIDSRRSAEPRQPAMPFL
ncbi:helix-turn-helix domain-containing protein [Terrabacter sp. GCM10028922]|uniref:helix-turn-helix domain-containing protein n=1 Tax=Terrabacter sp. GCM10028922 TaxID=3273428 RepID=UPI003618A24F